jgi:hypothetical protein
MEAQVFPTSNAKTCKECEIRVEDQGANFEGEKEEGNSKDLAKRWKRSTHEDKEEAPLAKGQQLQRRGPQESHQAWQKTSSQGSWSSQEKKQNKINIPPPKKEERGKGMKRRFARVAQKVSSCAKK